jgi:hypothetical protein
MKKAYLSATLLVLALSSAFLTGCPSSYSPSSPSSYNYTNTPIPSGPTGTPTQTATSTPSATITNTPTVTATSTITGTPTVTATSTATATVTNTPQNITISISSGSLGGYSGFYYTGGPGTNNTSNGLYSLSLNVGDIVHLPSGGIHTLYLDNGSTCFSGFSGETSASMPFTFTSAGTYYFQCGVHAQNCTTTSCSSTDCTAMAGVITVSP